MNQIEIVTHSRLTPEKFGADYVKICASVGLIPIPGGWGLLHCIDPNGRHWTLATADVGYAELAARLAATTVGADALPKGKFQFIHEGWPDEWVTK